MARRRTVRAQSTGMPGTGTDRYERLIPGEAQVDTAHAFGLRTPADCGAVRPETARMDLSTAQRHEAFALGRRGLAMVEFMIFDTYGRAIPAQTADMATAAADRYQVLFWQRRRPSLAKVPPADNFATTQQPADVVVAAANRPETFPWADEFRLPRHRGLSQAVVAPADRGSVAAQRAAMSNAGGHRSERLAPWGRQLAELVVSPALHRSVRPDSACVRVAQA